LRINALSPPRLYGDSESMEAAWLFATRTPFRTDVADPYDAAPPSPTPILTSSLS
jgi:hypothetical protein